MALGYGSSSRLTRHKTRGGEQCDPRAAGDTLGGQNFNLQDLSALTLLTMASGRHSRRGRQAASGNFLSCPGIPLLGGAQGTKYTKLSDTLDARWQFFGLQQDVVNLTGLDRSGTYSRPSSGQATQECTRASLGMGASCKTETCHIHVHLEDRLVSSRLVFHIKGPGISLPRRLLTSSYHFRVNHSPFESWCGKQGGRGLNDTGVLLWGLTPSDAGREPWEGTFLGPVLLFVLGDPRGGHFSSMELFPIPDASRC